MRLLADDEVFPLVAGSSFAADGILPDLLNDLDCGPLLRVYVAITDGRLGSDLTPEDRLYNRYFWFRRFANAHRAKFGEDAGIEQQAIQIFEHAECDFEWSRVEQLESAASAAH
jgi:hypothetical protein